MTITEVSMAEWCSVQDGESVVVFPIPRVCRLSCPFETDDQAKDQHAPLLDRMPARMCGREG